MTDGFDVEGGRLAFAMLVTWSGWCDLVMCHLLPAIVVIAVDVQHFLALDAEHTGRRSARYSYATVAPSLIPRQDTLGQAYCAVSIVYRCRQHGARRGTGTAGLTYLYRAPPHRIQARSRPC